MKPNHNDGSNESESRIDAVQILKRIQSMQSSHAATDSPGSTLDIETFEWPPQQSVRKNRYFNTIGSSKFSNTELETSDVENVENVRESKELAHQWLIDPQNSMLTHVITNTNNTTPILRTSPPNKSAEDSSQLDKPTKNEDIQNDEKTISSLSPAPRSLKPSSTEGIKARIESSSMLPSPTSQKTTKLPALSTNLTTQKSSITTSHPQTSNITKKVRSITKSSRKTTDRTPATTSLPLKGIRTKSVSVTNKPSGRPKLSTNDDPDRKNLTSSKILEYDLPEMIPKMSVLLENKRKEWDFRDPELIRALYVESATNLLGNWKQKHMKLKRSNRPQINNNWSTRLKMSYLQYKQHKIDRDTRLMDRLTKVKRARPDFPPVRMQNTLTSEYRHAFARNRPPVPHHYLEYFQDHRKLPFKIVQIKKNCRAKALD